MILGSRIISTVLDAPPLKRIANPFYCLADGVFRCGAFITVIFIIRLQKYNKMGKHLV